MIRQSETRTPIGYHHHKEDYLSYEADAYLMHISDRVDLFEQVVLNAGSLTDKFENRL